MEEPLEASKDAPNQALFETIVVPFAGGSIASPITLKTPDVCLTTPRSAKCV